MILETLIPAVVLLPIALTAWLVWSRRSRRQKLLILLVQPLVELVAMMLYKLYAWGRSYGDLDYSDIGAGIIFLHLVVVHAWLLILYWLGESVLHRRNKNKTQDN